MTATGECERTRQAGPAEDEAGSAEDACVAVAARLRSRRAELERRIYARLRNVVPNPIEDDGDEREAGARAAVSAVVERSLGAIERGETEWTGPVPQAVADHARRAARAEVSLGTILRRYMAGYRQLVELIVDEVESGGHADHRMVLRRLRETHRTLPDQLTVAVEHEYNQERERLRCGVDRRRLELVRGLLADRPMEPAELAELEYELRSAWHLGVVAKGRDACEILRRAKARVGHELLCVSCGGGTIWAWLGGQRRLTAAKVTRLLAVDGRMDAVLAVGEPRRGLEGWRRTHREAQLALPLARCGQGPLVRYADSPLLAAALRDDTLARSLEETYLTPLGDRRDGGAILRRTLRAYLEAGCNASSAASALKVGRHTVESRVHTAERLLGRQLRGCLGELDVALRLQACAESAESPDR